MSELGTDVGGWWCILFGKGQRRRFNLLGLASSFSRIFRCSSKSWHGLNNTDADRHWSEKGGWYVLDVRCRGGLRGRLDLH